jgi:hypothetical protein
VAGRSPRRSRIGTSTRRWPSCRGPTASSSDAPTSRCCAQRSPRRSVRGSLSSIRPRRPPARSPGSSRNTGWPGCRIRQTTRPVVRGPAFSQRTRRHGLPGSAPYSSVRRPRVLLQEDRVRTADRVRRAITASNWSTCERGFTDAVRRVRSERGRCAPILIDADVRAAASSRAVWRRVFAACRQPAGRMSQFRVFSGRFVMLYPAGIPPVPKASRRTRRACKEHLPVNLNRSLLKYSLSLRRWRRSPRRSWRWRRTTPCGLGRDDQRCRDRREDREKINGALVILQCSCLQGQREMTTNADGLYSFRNLPQGKYTVQVLFGQANVNKSMDVPAGAKFRANFQDRPEQQVPHRRRGPVEGPRRRRRRTRVKMDEVRTSRSAAPAATSRRSSRCRRPRADAAGVRLAGTTGAESKYVVDGAERDEPGVRHGVGDDRPGVHRGRRGPRGRLRRRVRRAARAAGQGAPHRRHQQVPRAGAAALLAARRGAALHRQTGRGAARRRDPRLRGFRACSRCRARSSRTSCSSRSASRRAGQKNSLIQSFYRRRDKDRSGGYEDCPYENGTNDCAANGNYIDSVKFAEQKFRTGRFDSGSARSTGRSRRSTACALSGGGGPSFAQQLPPAAGQRAQRVRHQPDAHDRRRVARRPGRRQRHLRHHLGNGTQVSLEYEGRVAEDKLEIDAGVYYTRGNRRRRRVEARRPEPQEHPADAGARHAGPQPLRPARPRRRGPPGPGRRRRVQQREPAGPDLSDAQLAVGRPRQLLELWGRTASAARWR